ncbi:hypothetical protein Cri9333_0904 [Crinalium epipsammum PCC 9333]|uniref:SbsA Ig-like domain-containing protein n=1 Tax=Crinalium epipsammum PCC 9333 TaxID=1173022 RepID=K9VW81_9CYAN|nr:Ig-like domain-containing protein [Crinalium epipsammum]AFZ11819.1 hypothetical protein Cri9333_0904 [Crinalium epipsammum PCC 9333]
MERRSNKADKFKYLQPVDRAAIALMLVLIVLIGLLIWNGDRTAPRVRNFSWQNQQVGAEDTSFTLNFNRPMDHASVEANLQIDPLLPGKFSWAGRRMAYTLTAPVFYGTNYKVQLQGAKDKSKTESGKENEKLIDPFYGQFSTRDRAFVYIGVEPQEKGRLILYNVTQQKKTVLTPADMAVNDFKIYPEGRKILFSAADWLSQKPGVFEQQLYTVTTGINPLSPGKPETKPEAAGKINLVLDSKNFQNMKFDLSPDGQAIIVQRVNRNKPGEFGLWVIKPGAPPQPLENQPGGDFLITADSGAVAVAQGQGIAILPMTPKAKPLDFLAQYAKVFSFSKDGASAAMLKFNTNYTRSLFLVTNQGVQKELFKTTGSILDAQFDPRSDTLYCLITRLQKGEQDQDQEQPLLATVDLKKAKMTPILALPNQRDIQMSLSQDGLALLFDQLVTEKKLPKTGALTTNDGQAIVNSLLWLLPITPPTEGSKTQQQQPQQLPLPGFRPSWLP